MNRQDSIPDSQFNFESIFTKKSAYDQSCWISKLFLGFVYPLLWKGFCQDGLELGDLQRCSEEDRVELMIEPLARSWENEMQKPPEKRSSFAWVLFKTNICAFFFPFLVNLFGECVLKISIPLLLGQLILLNDHQISAQSAWIYASALISIQFLCVIYDHLLVQQKFRLGMRARVSICALLYRKSLLLNSVSLGSCTPGQLINMMSNDVGLCDDFANTMAYLIISPLQALIVVCLVWRYLGASTLVGVVMLLLFIPFQACMGKLFSIRKQKSTTLTDTRLCYMTEIINGMRVIKMYCWEKPFSSHVIRARKAEIDQMRQTCYLQAVNQSIYFVSSRLIQFACFVCFVMTGHVLSTCAVYVPMALFSTIRNNMTFLFPAAIQQGSELLVTCKRIEKFLLLDEVQEFPFGHATRRGSRFEAGVSVRNISARWSKAQNFPTLENISLDLRPGELLMVIGPVASGKTSFLLTLLKELPLLSGSISILRSVSYASQNVWVFSGTIRENILFGLEFDERKYRKVLRVCALDRDVRLLPFGDHTLVGEKGVSLSGGQKARVNLARAIYRDSDIVFMDDPLSAVDAPVAKDLFERCIQKHLKPKIRILVTHQTQFLNKASKILILRNGQPWAYGTYHEVRESLGSDFAEFCTRLRSGSVVSFDGSFDYDGLGMDEVEEKFVEEGRKQPQEKQMTVDEEFERKRPGKWVYQKYLRAGATPCLVLLVILFSLISQSIFHGSDYYLTDWTTRSANETFTSELFHQKHDIIIYSIMIGALFFTTILRAMTFYTICMRASVKLHNIIFDKLIRAPVSFFEENSVGKILNRFSRDLRIIDEKISSTGFDLTIKFGQIIGVIVIVTMINWYLIFPAVILAFVSYLIRNVYIKSSLDIKRYEALTRSPIYTHIGATFSGLPTIRALNVQERFERQFHCYMNDHTSMWFVFLSTSRALGMVIEGISVLYMAIIVVSVMLTPGIDGSTSGLAITSALMLATITQLAVRQTAEMENHLTSIERFNEYQNLCPEDGEKYIKPGNTLSDQWPRNGEIEFRNLTMAYKAGKPVLRGLSFRILGGERIGIVGRTGAGKSSIISALFRLTKYEDSGLIRIDKVDIMCIELDRLRKSISIIPQDPVIFSGTVRHNLDPNCQCSDDQLWSVLEEVQLRDLVANFLGKLDEKLTECSLSIGQRQLVCLARALLRQNRILILDEATASVDHKLDQLIQKTIRSRFVDCTVLTIAHRLNTIIDCDRVMVMDAGQVVEFDTPYKLLKDSCSLFYEMCRKTGSSMFLLLRNLAKKANDERIDKI